MHICKSTVSTILRYKDTIIRYKSQLVKIVANVRNKGAIFEAQLWKIATVL